MRNKDKYQILACMGCWCVVKNGITVYQAASRRECVKWVENDRMED